ncbi:MAG TPA: hypothetical protein VJ978_16010, partial [Nitriliruptoraceae bacterium]|nr:hypothetical protein [Nitriliruptoraceae bacterium]
GQDVTSTVQQVISAMVSGIAFYLTRRLAGTLVAAMLLHAFYDAALFLEGEVQAPRPRGTRVRARVR